MHPSALPHRALRIAISCERRLFRDALADCLTKCSDFIVVGHVAGTDDLLELCELSCPDVVVLDISRRLPDGLNALRALRTRCPQTTVVMAYDHHLGPKEMKAALRSGVDTLVPCSHGLDALLTILRRGEYAVGVPDDQLTELDREILTLTGAGHPVGRIAELLGVSAGTVENCKRRLYHKLDVSGQSQAVARAAALGLMARTPRPEHSLPELTERETDILRSIGSGHTVRQTARILGIAEKTVENTQARLFRKLGVRNRAAAFAAAHAFGLVE